MTKTNAYRLVLALTAGIVLFSLAAQAVGPRQMENLDRGVVAVRKSSTEAFISWRLLGLDPAGIEFNVYRSANGGAAVKLNGTPLSGGCNYTDTTANLAQNNAYHIRPVIGGVEQAASAAWTLPANAEVGPLFRVPLQPPANRRIEKVWVGDLDGDGEYEYVLCWTATVVGETQKLQAYKRDGTLLWTVDFGLHSTDPNDPHNLGTASISAGQWDGVAVYDLDSDGKAEVIVKSAKGVTFGDGTVLTYGDHLTQFLSVLNGMTGAERDRVEFPHPWKISANRGLAPLFGIGYPDGVRPSLMIHAKSRNPDLTFNLIESAWDFRGGVLSNRWSIQWDGQDPNAPVNAHNIRIVDVDGDGKDELVPGMHAISSSGTLLWDLGSQGIVHGDRFHIGDLNPNRPGLEMYGIQQNNASGLIEYFGDAATAQMIWLHNIGSISDAARGSAVDIDPRYPGMECWSFYGIHAAADGTIISPNPTRPYPNLIVWWDGDLFGDNLHEEVVDKWNYASGTTSRLLTCWPYGTTLNSRSICAFQGDIIGDWREEIIFDSDLHNELVVFTTDHATTNRLYTLAHNPAYRNCLTTQGYRQQHIPDYFLGDGMSTPPTPNIVYTTNTPPIAAPNAPSGLVAAAVSASQINLTWTDNSSNENGFKIERSTDGIYFTRIATVGANATSYSNTGLSPLSTHYYRVRAYNGGGNSAYSNISSATTPNDPGVIVVTATLPGTSLPNQPGPTLATSSSFNMNGGNAVALFVTAERVALTEVVTATFAGQSMTLGVSTNEGVQWAGVFYLLNPATTSGQFVITISTSGGSGDYAYSAIALANVGGVADTDAIRSTSSDTTALFPVSYTTATDGGFILGAFANNGTSTSRDPEFVSGNADQTLLPPTIIDTSGHLHTYGDVPTAGAYTDNYRGQYQRNALVTLAFASGGSGGGTTPPSAPTGLTATAVSSSQINLNWNASSGATSYNVKRAAVSGGPYTTIATGVTTTSYPNTGLSASTTYYYVVSAVNANGESANSAQASATTQAPPDTTPPAAPTGLTATAGNATVSLDWADNTEPDLASYNVKRSTTSGGPYSVIATGVTSSAHTDNNVSNGTTYYYVVSAVDTSSNESANSAQVSATPTAPAGSTMHVADIQVDRVNLGAGQSKAQAVVTIVDNNGSPVANATVTVDFTEAIIETKSGVTDSNGVVTITTNGSAGNPAKTTGCVSNVTHASLTYNAAANVVTCDKSY